MEMLLAAMVCCLLGTLTILRLAQQQKQQKQQKCRERK